MKNQCFFHLFVLTLGVLLPLGALAQNQPRAHWTFDSSSIQGQTIKDQAGASAILFQGHLVTKRFGSMKALFLNRDKTLAEIPYDLESKALPKHQLTLEAWVNVEKTVEWGGILGAFQDNGGFEKGWLLGFKQSNFCFTLSSEDQDDGDGRMTEIRANGSLEWGKWYHVAATYDGFEMRLYVNGDLKKSSREQSGGILYADDAPFVLGAYMDSNEDFRWRGWIGETAIYDRALNEEVIFQHYSAKKDDIPTTYEAKIGPTLTRLDEETVQIEWESDTPTPSKVLFGQELPLTKSYADSEKKSSHSLVIHDIQPREMYYYRLVVEEETLGDRTSRLFEFDSTFDYTRLKIKNADNPYPEDAWTPVYREMAERVIENANVARGYCLVLDGDQGRFAYELARQSDWRIVMVEDEEQNVQTAREALHNANLYGVQISVHHGDLEKLDYGDFFANVIVSDHALRAGEINTPAREIYRVLRPHGGYLMLGQTPQAANLGEALSEDTLQEHFKKADIPELSFSNQDGTWVVARRSGLPGGGEWTHMYGDAANTANSNDPYLRDPLQVLWFGRPGPRPMLDRGTRNPSPVSTHGRLYIQGDRRLFGLDAYNGTILWTLEIPELRRANVPRDSSNMVAFGDDVYIAVKDRLWRLQGQSGKILATYPLPEKGDQPLNWGYLSRLDGIIVGSTVPEGGLYIGADGEWYDTQGYESYKVTSSFLFALDPESGEEKWSFESPAIINPTISIGDGIVYFIESRSPEAKVNDAGRMYEELVKDQYMVALELETGEKLWERAGDYGEGRWVFYLTYANNTLVLLNTTDQYHLSAYSAEDGKPLWKHEYSWYRNHHGGAMQQPVIVGDTVYAEPKVFKLKSGEDTRVIMPQRNKCGTITASAHCLFYRDFYHALWDLKKDVRRELIGIRPGCWLNMISAGGLLLAPEASAGCYCAHPIQTTVAFAPKKETE